MDQIAIGKFIAKKRKEKNFTQEQLAERLGVSNKTISKWETGRCLPDYSIAEIYGKFDEIAGDKTAIYISHRLSSCKFCDEIAVFHEGAVIQQGTHASLVADTNGKYYELWNAQAQYYTETA